MKNLKLIIFIILIGSGFLYLLYENYNLNKKLENAKLEVTVSTGLNNDWDKNLTVINMTGDNIWIAAGDYACAHVLRWDYQDFRHPERTRQAMRIEILTRDVCTGKTEEE